MNIINNQIFDLAEEIFDNLDFDFNLAVKKLHEASKKPYDVVGEFLLGLVNDIDYNEETYLLYIRNFISRSI